MDNTKPVSSIEFEDAMNEIDDIVRTLESGRASLKSTISLYARSMELYKHCQSLLDSANSEASKIFINADKEEIKNAQ